MAKHYNVTIEPMHPYNSNIIWPDLAKLVRRNMARKRTATNHLWRTLYEILEGNALRDRPIAYTARDWAFGAVDKLGKNDRLCFELCNFIVAIERWDN